MRTEEARASGHQRSSSFRHAGLRGGSLAQSVVLMEPRSAPGGTMDPQSREGRKGTAKHLIDDSSHHRYVFISSSHRKVSLSSNRAVGGLCTHRGGPSCGTPETVTYVLRPNCYPCGEARQINPAPTISPDTGTGRERTPNRRRSLSRPLPPASVAVPAAVPAAVAAAEKNAPSHARGVKDAGSAGGT